MSIIVILNFFCCCWWWWWWWLYIYIFFSVHQCTVMKTVLFYFNGYAVCVLHVVLKHFRDREIPLSPQAPIFIIFFFLKEICLIPPPFLSNWYPVGLTYSLPIIVAVREICHGTTHCLNTVDHSRWSQETHPAKRKKEDWATFKASPQKAPHTPAGLNLLHLVSLSVTNHI